MNVFTTQSALAEFLNVEKSKGNCLGFVPTMGALHKGHLSLIDAARRKTECVVASIFVNPTQFNDPKDLDKYPRPIEADVKLLEEAGCDVLFLPEVEEMYQPDEKWQIDLGYLDSILEGSMRPGHYQGVTQIVKKLFDAVKTDIAFFGQKDYQQIMVIKKMLSVYNIKTEIEVCPIIREKEGLAMSSRNIHLSSAERRAALNLFKVLKNTAENFSKQSIDKLKAEALSTLNKTELKVEYFELCEADSLQKATDKDSKIIALVAARAGNTRLIDNMFMN